MNLLTDEQSERLAKLAWFTYLEAIGLQAPILEYNWNDLHEKYKAVQRAIAIAVGNALLDEEVPKWRAERSLTYKRDTYTKALYREALEQLRDMVQERPINVVAMLCTIQEVLDPAKLEARLEHIR